MRRSPTPELDLAPIMNLVTILIPFLLFSASFVSLAAIDSAIPAIGPTPDSESADPSLDLSLEVDNRGYQLRASQPLAGQRTFFARSGRSDEPDDWPAADLTAAPQHIKETFPDEDTLILLPESTLPYEVLIHTMDAAHGDRGELFPAVVMAAGGA